MPGRASWQERNARFHGGDFAAEGKSVPRIGLVEAFAGFYLPEGFKDIAAYVVVLIMLVVKPNGLFGGAMRKKV